MMGRARPVAGVCPCPLLVLRFASVRGQAPQGLVLGAHVAMRQSHGRPRALGAFWCLGHHKACLRRASSSFHLKLTLEMISHNHDIQQSFVHVYFLRSSPLSSHQHSVKQSPSCSFIVIEVWILLQVSVAVLLVTRTPFPHPISLQLRSRHTHLPCLLTCLFPACYGQEASLASPRTAYRQTTCRDIPVPVPRIAYTCTVWTCERLSLRTCATRRLTNRDESCPSSS